jgi:selenocysteine lyase/cysteine desulfurase
MAPPRPLGLPGAAGYLDSATVGLVPAAVTAELARCYGELAAGSRALPGLYEDVEAVKCALAHELGARADDIAFMSSTGEALNALARAIPFRPDAEVLVLEDDFPTVVLPWTRVAPAPTVVAVAPGPGDDRLAALLAAITPRTQVVCVSHVAPYTGTRLDLGPLRAATRAVGSLLVVDGAQALGCIPVDVAEADVYVATAYKWLMSGYGISAIVMGPEVRSRLRPGLVGHVNPPPSTGLNYGRPNFAGILALGAALQVRQAIGPDLIHERVRDLTSRVRATAEALGLEPVAAAERTAGIVCLAGTADASDAVTRLKNVGFVVAERAGRVRISPHFYTSDCDIDRLLDVLRGLPVEHTR